MLYVDLTCLVTVLDPYLQFPNLIITWGLAKLVKELCTANLVDQYKFYSQWIQFVLVYLIGCSSSNISVITQFIVIFGNSRRRAKYFNKDFKSKYELLASDNNFNTSLKNH